MRTRRPADDARGMVGGQGRRCPDGKAMARYERKDAVYRKARGAGLRSRASVKLEEIDQIYQKLIRDLPYFQRSRVHSFHPSQRR